MKPSSQDPVKQSVISHIQEVAGSERNPENYPAIILRLVCLYKEMGLIETEKFSNILFYFLDMYESRFSEDRPSVFWTYLKPVILTIFAGIIVSTLPDSVGIEYKHFMTTIAHGLIAWACYYFITFSFEENV